MLVLQKEKDMVDHLLNLINCKKPIIASGWSGQLDFLNPMYTTLLPGKLENVHASAANQWLKAESQWFQVSPKHFINALKSVHQKYKKFIIPAKQQGHHIKTKFSFDAYEKFSW